MKKNKFSCLIGRIMLGAVLFSLMLNPFNKAWAAEEYEDAPAITAEYAIVIEAVTGRVIYEKNADERAYPASLTKMLTCIIALEDNHLDRLLTVSKEAAATEDPYLILSAGDKLTERNLLKGLMMVSDNNSAVVLAEGISGSVSNFAVKMNKKVKDIGLKHSNFVTPNGLPHENHYSTARDMAYIAAYAWNNEEFRKIVGTQFDSVKWDYPAKHMDVENSNKLLGRMPGCNGIKTGWTMAAGGCLAAAAKRNGVQLIAVVLKSADVNTRFSDAEKILDYSFSKVKQVKAMDKSRTEKTVFVTKGSSYKVTAHPQEDVVFPMLNGDTDKDYNIKFNGNAVVQAPIEKGQQVGNIVVYYKGKELRQIPMVTDNEVAAGYNIISIVIGGIHGFMEMFSR